MPIPTSKTPAGSQKSELQPDDVQILRLLANDFLLLSNEQIFQLLPNRPPRAINRRLERLVNAGYLSRRYPSRLFLNTTRASYAVGPEAAHVPMLETSDSQLLARLQRSRDFSDTALPHLFFTNMVQIKFLTAGNQYPDYRLESWIQQYDPLWAKLNREGFHLQPDGLAKLWKGDRRFLYFIEADRGTYRGEHLEKRLALYVRYASKYPHATTFEFKHPRFRVLFIAESPDRAKGLLKTLVPYHPDLFWVTSWKDFSRQSLFQPSWRTHDTLGLHALDEACQLPPDPPEPPPPP